jgi:hypothetical protein
MFARAIHLDWLAESLANESIKTGNRHTTALQKFDELDQISRFLLYGIAARSRPASRDSSISLLSTFTAYSSGSTCDP